MNARTHSLAVVSTVAVACTIFFALAARPARAHAQDASDGVRWSPWSEPLVLGEPATSTGASVRGAKASTHAALPILVLTSRAELPTDTSDDDRELMAIDSLSHTATSLYAAAPLLLAMSTALFAGAAAEGPSLSCEGACSAPSPEWMVTFAVLGVATGVGSLVSLIVAIAMDAESARRREALDALHRTGPRWHVAGGPGQLGIGIAGEF